MEDKRINPFATPLQLRPQKRKHSASHLFITKPEYDYYTTIDNGINYTKLIQEDLQQTLEESSSSLHTQELNNSTRHLADIIMEIKGKDSRISASVDNFFRRISTLTIEEHEQYLHFLWTQIQAYQNGLPRILSLSQEQQLQYTAIRLKVIKEQQIFRQLLKGFASRSSNNSLSYTAPSASKWTTKVIEMQSYNVKRLYPQYYEPCLNIRLRQNAGDNSSNAPAFRLQFIQEAASPQGTMRILNPSMLSDSNLPLKLADVKCSLTNSDRSDFANQKPISEDPIAQELVDKFDCHFAMSSSTLTTIFYPTSMFSNFSRQKQNLPSFIVPVIVKQTIKPGSANKYVKRIFLDSKLSSPATATSREKIALNGRWCMLSQITEPSVKDSDNGDSSNGLTKYHIWQLGEKRLLIRCTIHAFSNDGCNVSQFARAASEHSESGSFKESPVSVFVKPDCQDMSVPEEITVSEWHHMWMHSWIRGSSKIIFCRLDPYSNSIFNWETHSTVSFFSATNASTVHPAHSLQFFEPMENFENLNNILSSLSEVPIGVYLLQPEDPSSEEADYQPGNIKLLMKIESSDMSKSTIPVQSVFDLYTYASLSSYTDVLDEMKLIDTNDGISSEAKQAPQSNVSEGSNNEYVAPAWLPVPFRVPYTFRTGTYCYSYFRTGVCSIFSKSDGSICHDVHLKLSLWNVSDPKTWWHFEGHGMLRSGKDISLQRLKILRIKFNFCKYALPSDLENPFSPVMCMKGITNKKKLAEGNTSCKEPHFTIHQVAERLANQVLIQSRSRAYGKKKSKITKS